MGNYSQAWNLYSTYNDALNRVNPWNCTYDWTQYFPGNCAPNGQLSGQGSRLENWYDGQQNVGFFVEGPAIWSTSRTFGGIAAFNGTDVGDIYYPGRGSFDVSLKGPVYLRGSGYDIWGNADSFYFVSHVVSGNFTLVVRVADFSNNVGQSWAKTCLMLRKSLNANSASFEICLTGGNGFAQQWRDNDGNYKSSYNSMWDGTSPIRNGWLQLVKKGNAYSSYISSDGINWSMYGNVQNLPNLASATYNVGIGVSSSNNGYVTEAKIDNYQYLSYPSRMACSLVQDTSL